MENQETMFKPGQKLEVTDNTGKPTNPVQTLKVISIDYFHPTYGPEYFVYIDNPDESELLEHGELTHETLWRLDQAIKENRIFVKVLEG